MLSVAQSTAKADVETSVGRSAQIVLILLGCGLLESMAAYYTPAWPLSLFGFSLWLVSCVVYVTVTGLLILLFSQATRPLAAPAWIILAVLALGFTASLIIAHVAMEGFPNSGDEFGYNYLADTFLRGRVWNPPMPSSLHDVFDTFYIGDQDGKRASQYPPGWPALLALFKLLHMGQYANAVVGLMSSVFLWLALRCVRAPNNVRLGIFILGASAPFVLFNNASYFNHALTGACLSAIIWLDLRPRSIWNYLFIGVLFSALMTVRYETCAIAGALFVLDGLIRRRFDFIKPALTAAVGALPIITLFLWYNWRITGNPLETTLAWASPDITFGLGSTGIDGPHTLTRGFRHTAMWLLSWQEFASVLILPLFALALWRRVVTAKLRWFDLLLPAVMVFFVFYPDYGGFQYGPRYWFFGYVGLPVTIAAGLLSADGLWHFRRWSFDPVRVSLLQLASFAGFAAGFASYVHLQTEVRETPFRVAMTAPPNSLVLMGDTSLPYVSWQLEGRMTTFRSKDFTRNGPDGLTGSLILGRAPDSQQEMSSVCEMFLDRHIFRLVVSSPPPTGHLEPICGS